MIARTHYLEILKELTNKPLIKVITGIRRSGKSTLLKLLREELERNGIESQRIISVNFESFKNIEISNALKLYAYIEEKISGNQKHYILLDEIQEVEGWEKVINSLMVDFNVDLFITGSNSHMLSSELATFLGGRYVEIPIYTLSYKEVLTFRENYAHQEPIDGDSFVHYLRLGGFPVIHLTDYQSDTAYKIVRDIYSSVILKDTVQRYKIRDVELLERVIKYAFDNIGNTFSGKNVADYFKSQQRKVDVNTVYNYLTALEGAFVLYRTPRYDLKGKEILKTQEKFYLSDISLLYATMGYRDRFISGVLENVVFLELKRRGYNVFVGKFGQKEIDFVGEKENTKIYIQVTYKMEREETIEREFSSLLEIKDQYPKYVVSMDKFWQDNIEGIRHVYIADFLLEEW